MKWYQKDNDFLERPGIRAIVAKHGSSGVHIVEYVWSHVAKRLDCGDASCRLYETIDMVAHDTGVHADKVASIYHTGEEHEYESINGYAYPVFDTDAITPHRIGASVLFYKMDNATRNDPRYKVMRDNRRIWEQARINIAFKPLASNLQVTCSTYKQTDIQTDLLPMCGPSLVGVESGIDIHQLMKAHARQEHKAAPVAGCPTCQAEAVAAAG